MTYGELQSTFTALLNRRDNTSDKTKAFLQASIQKIQRSLRVPAMEKSIQATIGNLFTDGLDVPGDLLQFIALTDVTTGDELVRSTLPEVLHAQINETTGCSRIFARRGSKFLIGPKPQAGSKLRMDYYAQFAPLVNDGDTNVLTDIASDLIYQGALVFAATHFNDKRKSDFQADYNKTFDDLTEQADRDELTGNACVAPAFRFDED